ncbi:MAG: patatin-like phospholipase family protein [Candidatus Magnetomorum sp.]|nr:patatin-like phospholipase family protein [Candidatus Magnetomorum sp.]
MGITFVQKSDLSNPKPNPKIALVLSGGAVSGGAFKVGGLSALSNFMINQNIRDFDIYVGVSAGSILSVFLANGIPTSEISKSMEGRKGMLDPIMASEFYYFNYREFISKPLMMFGDLVTRFPRGIYRFLQANNVFRAEFRRRLLTALANPIYENLEAFFVMSTEIDMDEDYASIPWGYIPSSIFNTDNFEQSIRKNLERNKLCNDFIELYEKRGKRLYVASTKLDTAERVIFGTDEINTVTISKAMQASIAVPIFYKPVRIDGSDYVDGGVIKTASMDVAIDKGADLVICYNPFRPINFETYSDREKRKRRLNIADDGLYALINQVFRTMLHTRLMHGMDYYRADPNFKGDIILIEPSDYDHKFFDMNPLAFWERRKAARRGYQSVKESISLNYDLLQKILNAYGIITSWEFAQDPQEMYRQHQNLELVN